MAKPKGAGAWDDAENEAQNSFVSWSKEGDYILGTLLSKKEIPSTLPDKKGEMQFVYEVKVKECSYHVLDDKKKVIEEAIEPEAGEIISVGGRKMIDSRMAHVKIGQVFGLKFVEELPAKTKGYNPTKLIRVYVPKDKNGEYEMDSEMLAQQEVDNF